MTFIRWNIMLGNRGFTLIELMVTIAVAAILVTIAAPSFGTMMENQNLKRSTQDLVAILTEARSQAVLERVNVEVKLNKTLNTLTTLETTALNNKRLFIWQPQGKAVLKSGSPTSITFELSGAVKNYSTDIQNKPFVVCNYTGGGISKEISISIVGTPRIGEGTC